MKLLNTYEGVRFPAWALVAMTYGDTTGLTPEEVELLDKFVESWKTTVKEDGGTHFGQDTTGESYFTHYPEFGPACECFDMTIYIWGE